MVSSPTGNVPAQKAGLRTSRSGHISNPRVSSSSSSQTRGSMTIRWSFHISSLRAFQTSYAAETRQRASSGGGNLSQSLSNDTTAFPENTIHSDPPHLFQRLNNLHHRLHLPLPKLYLHRQHFLLRKPAPVGLLRHIAGIATEEVIDVSVVSGSNTDPVGKSTSNRPLAAESE